MKPVQGGLLFAAVMLLAGCAGSKPFKALSQASGAVLAVSIGT